MKANCKMTNVVLPLLGSFLCILYNALALFLCVLSMDTVTHMRYNIITR